MNFLSARGTHEHVARTQLRDGSVCIIAVHSTRLGPSLGGTRLFPYASDAEALADALRLSETMTYKAACAGLPIGGGKAVIVGLASEKSPDLFRSFREFVNEFKGSYIAACDMNVTPEDLRPAREVSQWIHGMPRSDGGCGDSFVLTAFGVYLGIRTCLAYTTGSTSLSGRSIGIDGAGKVGRRLARMLSWEGADLYNAALDVISPNSIGGRIDFSTASSLRCKIVAGAANNQLVSAEAAEALLKRGILYAPDFVINADGLIQVVDELHEDGTSHERSRSQVYMIPARLQEIFWRAHQNGLIPHHVALKMAQQRLCRSATSTIR
ncbi:MAG: Glu/Leu/Phe/Val dehydrogenase [Pseudonocardia sp.]|nr:Glu/Leu/Phe/Val dehydrogenase [Pseudonocardia sp.]